MWVRPSLLEQLEPVDVGWFSHQRPFEFDIHQFEYAHDANRFWGGTPSVVPYVIASNSIKQALQIGIESIRQHNLSLTQLLIDNLATNNLVSPASPECRGGTLIIKFEHHQSILKKLREEGVAFDERSFGVRMSPHIYNSTDEIERVLASVV